MNKVYFSLGSNIGDKLQNLVSAITTIANKIGVVEKVSSIYEAEPWGEKDQPWFLNQVLIVNTPLAPEEVLKIILEIEETMGRVREMEMGPRVIDIDILLVNDEVINTADLQVPHPHMANRNFVLVPLSEIASEIIHPVLHKTIGALLSESKDPSVVKKPGDSGQAPPYIT